MYIFDFAHMLGIVFPEIAMTEEVICNDNHIVLYLMLSIQFVTLLMVGYSMMNLSGKVGDMYKWVAREDDEGVKLVYGSMLMQKLREIERFLTYLDRK